MEFCGIEDLKENVHKGFPEDEFYILSWSRAWQPRIKTKSFTENQKEGQQSLFLRTLDWLNLKGTWDTIILAQSQWEEALDPKTTKQKTNRKSNQLDNLTLHDVCSQKKTNLEEFKPCSEIARDLIQRFLQNPRGKYSSDAELLWFFHRKPFYGCWHGERIYVFGSQWQDPGRVLKTSPRYTRSGPKNLRENWPVSQAESTP